MRRLPPLNTLRAFEAAARLQSFAGAATELRVTPAAISQQIRSLECALGCQLFSRRARGVTVTATGADYARQIGDLLDRLVLATDRLRELQPANRLTIATTPSFAAHWLMPRLIRFLEQHPRLDVRLSTSNALADLHLQDVDIAVRYGDGRWPGLVSLRLTDTLLFPVCSPAFLAAQRKCHHPRDLQPRTLLRLIRDDWPLWLSAAGVTRLRPAGPQFSDIGLLTQAAAAGQGVALGQSTIVADDLASGRLVAPFSIEVPARHAYFLVGSAEAVRRAPAAAFHRWLERELVRSTPARQQRCETGGLVERQASAPGPSMPVDARALHRCTQHSESALNRSPQ